MRRFSRRAVLGTIGVLAASACVRPAPRATPEPRPTALPGRDEWRATAHAILSDALEALRAFDAFAAYRIAAATSSTFRSPSELLWDPPSAADWDEATRIARGTHGRAEQLLVTIGRTQMDQSLWRERRDVAEATYELIELGDALAAYRNRVDHLGVQGDGSGALDLLAQAWARWEASAARWDVNRAELIGCSS